jgi:hypothetical protein
MLVITLLLCALAICAVAKVARVVMRRFGLDPMDALLWLGLAERPSGNRPARPSAVRDGSAPSRRRSSHRPSLSNRARRSAA